MLQLLTEPEYFPLSLDEIKAHLRNDLDIEDDLFLAYMDSALDYIESQTGRAYMQQTWRETFDEFPKGGIVLSKPPLQEVLSVKYYDGVEDEPVEFTEFYVLKPHSDHAEIWPLTCWPSSSSTRQDKVQVEFTCGYSPVGSGSGEGRVPPRLLQALRLAIGAWNENREDEITGTITSKLKLGLDALIQSLKTGRYR